MSEASAEIGVIGGSGLYRLLATDAEEVRLDTPYGAPSDRLTLAEVAGRRVAFLPRHGERHTLPPHRINYRANIAALDSLGVRRVIAPCAVGSLDAGVAPGDVVVCDGLVDRTHSRADSFFDGPEVAHLSAPDPYCEQLRPLAVAAARDAGLRVHEGGTVVVIQGPRFATRAESHQYRALGCQVINMTQHPEAPLARERGMCYVSLSLVTDHDAGVAQGLGVEPVTQEQVFAVFARNTARLRDALLRLVELIPEERTCGCLAATPRPLGQA